MQEQPLELVVEWVSYVPGIPQTSERYADVGTDVNWNRSMGTGHVACTQVLSLRSTAAAPWRSGFLHTQRYLTPVLLCIRYAGSLCRGKRADGYRAVQCARIHSYMAQIIAEQPGLLARFLIGEKVQVPTDAGPTKQECRATGDLHVPCQNCVISPRTCRGVTEKGKKLLTSGGEHAKATKRSATSCCTVVMEPMYPRSLAGFRNREPVNPRWVMIHFEREASSSNSDDISNGYSTIAPPSPGS